MCVCVCFLVCFCFLCLCVSAGNASHWISITNWKPKMYMLMLLELLKWIFLSVLVLSVSMSAWCFCTRCSASVEEQLLFQIGCQFCIPTFKLQSKKLSSTVLFRNLHHFGTIVVFSHLAWLSLLLKVPMERKNGLS